MFEPLLTDRLLLRAPIASDVEALHERRNEPLLADYQAWSSPYARERAVELIDGVIDMGGPQSDEWWMVTVADRSGTEIIGDLALHLTSEGRCAEIGYTLASRYWGNGYATEALRGLITWLFDEHGVSRVHGTVHPDNVASAMVLERTGFLYEGRARLSCWVGDENSDDLIYGMTRTDWTDWITRPQEHPAMVELVEVDTNNGRDVGRLITHKSQERFVAPTLYSFSDALFPEVIDGAPVVPWMRGVVADGEYVGFVMLAVVTEHHHEPYLWRLLVDRRHQRRGVGKTILDQVVRHCRAQGWPSLVTSWGEGKGSPRLFYERYGFEPTGEIVDDETEARIRF